MSDRVEYEAVVIGSGPNGLAAAIELARNGRSVLVVEGNDTIGGSCRSAELTLPGFVHDICSTVQALALGSPFMRSVPLAEHGLELVHPAAPVAHPLDDGPPGLLWRSVDETAAGLGEDGPAYRNVFRPLVDDWRKLTGMLLGPPPLLPPHPIALARFGLRAIRSAKSFVDKYFRTAAARALFGGVAAHSIRPLDTAGTAAFGLVLTLGGHADGWPVAKGGSQKLADALASYLRSLGGKIEPGRPVKSLDELPRSPAVLCDVTPRQLVQIAGDKLPASYRDKLNRWQYGPGAFKVDWALDGPVPWKNPEVAKAGTVHL